MDETQIDSATPNAKPPDWNPPKWWRLSILVLPFALFAEAVALMIVARIVLRGHPNPAM